jgi:multimeric flavodoxin WrbA
MNILAINGSPKKKGGASSFFIKVLRFMLFPKRIKYKALGLSKNYESIFAELETTDVVVFSVPLYVDGIPSHMINFLTQLEQLCIKNKYKFMLYVISNSGFVEGKQNQAHLEQYKCWCERSGITWGGGLGIGGGVMLNVIFYLIFLFSTVRFAVGIIFNIVFGYPIIDNQLLYGYIRSISIWLLFSSGMLFSKIILAWAIRWKKSIKNMYTRVMIPSFIFLIFASIFMAMSAFFNGKIFSLNKKGDYSRYLK